MGGDFFFSTDEPEHNSDHLIRIVERDEKAKLLQTLAPIPEGLRRAILFYLLSSAALIQESGAPEHGKGYSFLCHPSLKNKEQAVARERIDIFLAQVTAALLKSDSSDKQIWSELDEEYENLKLGLTDDIPSIQELSRAIVTNLRTRKILVINAATKRQGIAYGPELNFLIGGNTLGRGIAIRDLLLTYYIRDSRISQIDTMHQHASMFGYRKHTLPYTRLFIPRHLYYRFRDIHRSDEDLRKYINKYKENPETFPIEFTYDLRTTRTGVLNVNTTDTLEPGKQVYPNYIVLPQSPAAYSNVEQQLVAHFGPVGPTMDANGKSRKMISAIDAVNLIKPIKTKSKNTWSDKTIGAVIRKVSGELGGMINLKYREAERTVADDGFMATGALSGIAYEGARKEDVPTLWVLNVQTTDGSFCGGGKRFMYPTFVIPDKLEKLFMFSRG